MRDRAKAGADHHAEDRLPEVHAEHSDGQHADEDRRELEIGRGPGPEQLAGLAVAVCTVGSVSVTVLRSSPRHCPATGVNMAETNALICQLDIDVKTLVVSASP